MIRNAYRYASLLFLGLLGLACAGQIAPSGGPPDTTPPEIVATVPAPGTLGFQGSELRLAFSEYVDRRSLEESVFLSPPVGRLEFDWSGTEVAIRFRDTLRPRTTYILTVGTDVRDVREKGNRMSASFALPFSTGDHIDSASIAGRVFDASPGGIMIFAYRLSAHRPDTLNPETAGPDFVTQTGKDGTFRMPYLPLDSYRLIAVEDAYKNLRYDRQIDRYGLSTGDVRVTADSFQVSGVQFRMAREDTSAPFLSSVKALDRRHFLVRFSEALDTSGISPAAFAVVDTLSGQALPVVDASFTDTSRLDAQLVTAPQDSGKAYRVTLSGMRDLAGNSASAASASAVVLGSALEDTTRPLTLFPFPQDTMRNIAQDIILGFSWKEAVRKPSFEGGVRLADSAGSPLRAAVRWDGAMNAVLVPAAPFVQNGLYALRIQVDSVVDMSGNRSRDSVRTFRFRIGDDRQTSSIAGRVVAGGAAGDGRLHLLAENIAGGGQRYEAVLDSAGPFLFPKVEEGRYAFELYRDADANNAYSFGKPFPYLPAEAFAVHPDTVKVRARWPVEGIVVRMR
jgi:hypothetical protein